MKFSVDLKDGDKLIATLNRLQVETAVEVADAIKESAKAVRREARARVPVLTGEFRRRIGYKISRDKLTAEVAAWRKGGGYNNRRPHPLAHLIEFGTAAHVIRPEKKKALKFATEGSTETYRLAVQHPGTPAKPFLFPAYEAERANYVQRLNEALNKAAKKAK